MVVKLAVLTTVAAALTGGVQTAMLNRRAITSCSRAASQLSCHASQTVDPSSDATCCYNGALASGDQEGGLLAMTQFWDTNPSTGPSNSATIHGLWPDYCSHGYPASCSSKSGIPTTTGSHIRSVIEQYDPDTLRYMNTYYKDYQGDDESFWEHEWNKHGTCYTSLRSKCFSPSNGMNAADAAILGYFQQIVRQFKTLPTYSWLADADITPSSSQTYALTDIQDALSNAFGAEVYVGCENGDTVDEFWYFFNTKGGVVNATFYPTDSNANSNCNSYVNYPPK